MHHDCYSWPTNLSYLNIINQKFKDSKTLIPAKQPKQTLQDNLGRREDYLKGGLSELNEVKLRFCTNAA